MLRSTHWQFCSARDVPRPGWTPVLHTFPNPNRQTDPKAHCNVSTELSSICNCFAPSENCGNKSPRGPISLALRSEAPVVPMYLVRNYGGDMNLIIEPEIELVRTGSLGEDIATNTRRMVRYLECLIGKYPDQWNWLAVRLNKHHLNLTPDMNVSDSSNLDPLSEDIKKHAADEEDQLPILCWQASMEKKDCVMPVSRSYEGSFTRQGLIPVNG